MGRDRKIIHCDMDAFYASVKQKDCPELKGQPVVVGGAPQSRSVVAAASYEARRLGIRSAMSCAQAFRLCPKAIFLKPNFGRYKEVSREIHRIFHTVTDLVEPLSLDEAYLDVTENQLGESSATQIARHIKSEILIRTGLTASARVGPNKFIAKVASEIRKPNGLTVVPPERVLEFLKPLLVGKMWGVETTFEKDVRDPEVIVQVLASQAREVASLLTQIERRARTVTVKIKYADFVSTTRSKTLSHPISDAERIGEVAFFLMKTGTHIGRRAIRLIGLSVSGLIPKGSPFQLSFFDSEFAMKLFV